MASSSQQAQGVVGYRFIRNRQDRLYLDQQLEHERKWSHFKAMMQGSVALRRLAAHYNSHPRPLQPEHVAYMLSNQSVYFVKGHIFRTSNHLIGYIPRTAFAMPAVTQIRRGDAEWVICPASCGERCTGETDRAEQAGIHRMHPDVFFAIDRTPLGFRIMGRRPKFSTEAEQIHDVIWTVVKVSHGQFGNQRTAEFFDALPLQWLSTPVMGPDALNELEWVLLLAAAKEKAWDDLWGLWYPHAVRVADYSQQAEYVQGANARDRIDMRDYQVRLSFPGRHALFSCVVARDPSNRWWALFNAAELGAGPVVAGALELCKISLGFLEHGAAADRLLVAGNRHFDTQRCEMAVGGEMHQFHFGVVVHDVGTGQIAAPGANTHLDFIQIECAHARSTYAIQPAQ